jgi:hypothetical protein
VNRIFEQQGYSHSLKSSGEIVSFGPQLKSLQNFEKMVHEKGIRAAAEERDRPFGGIVGRYPPPAED